MKGQLYMQQPIKDKSGKIKYQIKHSSASFNFSTKKYECGESMAIVIPLTEHRLSSESEKSVIEICYQ